MLWRMQRFLQTLDQRGLVGLQVARQARRLCLGFDNVLEYALKYSIDEERFTFRSRCHLASRDRSLRPLPPSGTVSARRSEEHTSELQSLMRISYAVFCLKKKKQIITIIQDYLH